MAAKTGGKNQPITLTLTPQEVELLYEALGGVRAPRDLWGVMERLNVKVRDALRSTKPLGPAAKTAAQD